VEGDTVFVDDPLQTYLNEVQRIPPLGRAEELECIRHVVAGDELAQTARTRLVEASLHLVVSIASRYKNERVHILDLIEKGNEGLIRAIETLPEQPVDPFSMHAVSYVERAIAGAMANPSDPPVPARRRVPIA
jgi:DNA-directed RNA polymerase sigma subunit (sigma70/sigma32)